MAFASEPPKMTTAVWAPHRKHTEFFEVHHHHGHLHYHYVEQGAWRKDENSFTAAKVHGDLSAVYELQRSHTSVFFRGSDGLLNFFYVTVVPGVTMEHLLKMLQ